MRFAYQGFYARNHSWSYVAQNVTRALIRLNQSVDVFSTNGDENIPIDLLPNISGSFYEGIVQGSSLANNYDATLSYTALKNAPKYLQHSKKNRFLFWTYEFAGKNSLPLGFAKNHNFTDLILPPSNFAKQIFIDSGIPEEKLQIISHGVNCDEIRFALPYPLKTRKSTKILINLGQVHARKNLPNALKMFGEAFTNKDDVCLIIKVQEKKPQYSFELSFQEIFRDFKKKYSNHAEVEIIQQFIPNIYSLYKSVDFTFSPSNCEGFGLVPLEGLAVGVFPIASNYGGFKDFLTSDNSLLIEGSEFNVPPSYLYYQQKAGTKAFQPDIDSGIKQLRYAKDNLQELKNKAKIGAKGIIDKYNWLKIGQQVLDLCK